METPKAPIPKLPVWQTVGLAYKSLFTNPGAAIRCSWAWLLIMTPVVFAISWLMWLVTSPIDAKVAASLEGHPDPTAIEMLVSFLANWVDTIVELPALSAMAVAWHRLLLLGEVPHPTNLRFGNAVRGYLAFSAFLMALQVVASLGMTSAMLPPKVDILRGLLWIAASMIALTITGLFIFPRFSLYLPAVALGRDIALREVWRRTRRNTWRLAFGTILTVVPMLVALTALAIVMPSGEGQTGAASSSVAMFWATALTTFIAVAFLSYAYRHFFERATESTDLLT